VQFIIKTVNQVRKLTIIAPNIINKPSSVTPDISNLSYEITRDPILVRESQKLRYRVFCEEMGANPDNPDGVDEDEFDQYCDHLLVFENVGEARKVIGTYRALPYPRIKNKSRFVTESEYDVSRVLSALGENIMEVGRSCVDPSYRSGSVIQLLWRAIADYCEMNQIDALFGCASFHGADANDHRESISYLNHYHLAPEEMRPMALPELAVDMEMLPKDSIPAKRAFVRLPPLIKGYIRLGGVFGDKAVIDKVCNTTDVCVVVTRQNLTERYSAKFRLNANDENFI
jgi:putative hemolysin